MVRAYCALFESQLASLKVSQSLNLFQKALVLWLSNVSLQVSEHIKLS